MKTRSGPMLLLLATVMLTASRLDADPVVGTPRDAVISELGTPRSLLAVGADELLTYPRGTVSLSNGVVTKTSLLSLEEWARREHLRLTDVLAKADADARESARRREMKREDNEAMDNLMATAEWKDANGAERVAMIDRFSRIHPYADVGSVRPAAELRRDRDTAEQNRLSDLETRVTAAESRAGEAESRARVAENNAASASAEANAARRSADAAARNAAAYNTGIVAYSYIGGRPYDYYRPTRGTVVVDANGTVITGGRGPVTIIRTNPVTTYRPIAPVPPGQAPNAPAPNPPNRAPGTVNPDPRRR